MTTPANADMVAAWDGDDGADWAANWERYDRAARSYHRVLMTAAEVRRADRVLDIGCGNGQPTRDAARAAVDGSALGVDLSSRMIERARERAQAEGVTNVAFIRADAQTHPFTPGDHDLALSRFGAMFFDDPVQAFSNIGASIRPAGRLTMLAWRRLDDNAWLQMIRGALAAGRDLPTPPAGLPGPFGLADPDQTRTVLSDAGFEHIELAAVDEQLWFGADVDAAFDHLSRTGMVRGLSEGLDDDARAAALDRLRDELAAHTTDDGVELSSAAWLITARRPGG